MALFERIFSDMGAAIAAVITDMDGSGTLLRSISLENGLLLQLMDRSRRIAADRWHIRIKAFIDISVQDALRNTRSYDQKEEIENVLGKQVLYEKEMIRNFIDEKEKQAVINQVCSSFLENAMTYLSRQHFAERFVLRQYKEMLEKKRIENLLQKGVTSGDPSE
ncbi:hypothetical protein [Desulfatirhabdium butyrativorans]|uniref:hypothetical protein n=1 Tax=Desulfatirhabdium butyrativorans TaxID=340467 RepID=UPI0003FBB7D5|nr:hypothetical protein [Desulfatirhabdium butyrativorans]